MKLKKNNITSINKLLKHDAQAVENVFNKLSLNEKIELVLRTPWEKRLDIILLAADSRQLVQSLPEDEIYWTVKSRGIEDSLAIIARTNYEQFQYMVDIDCWNRDSINVKNVALWSRMLGKCNESKVLEWFSKADEEYLICSMKKFVKIVKMADESDISEEYEKMPSCTLDGVIYFKFVDDEDRLIIMPLLNVLYENNRERFYSIIEGIIWDSEIEAEEEALRWRQSRVSEKGFPDFVEAGSVYQFISDKEINSLKQSIKNSESIIEEKSCSADIKLRYTFAQAKIPSFLQNLLQQIDSIQILDDIQRHIINLANKIIIADSLEPGSKEDMEWSLNKVAGYINIGLEFLCEGNINIAINHLAKTHPEILFRAGYATVIKLQKRAEKLNSALWHKEKDLFYTFFGTPWADAVKGLIRKRPLFFAGLVDKSGIEQRDFMTLSDVKEAGLVLDIVETTEKFIIEFFRVKSDKLVQTLIHETSLNSNSEIKIKSVFLTLLANHVLYGRTELVPLTIEELKIFLKAVFEQRGKNRGYCLKKEIQEDFILWIYSLVIFDERNKSAMKSFLVSCLSTLEEEFSSLAGKKVIDIRYVSGLILMAV